MKDYAEMIKKFSHSFGKEAATGAGAVTNKGSAKLATNSKSISSIRNEKSKPPKSEKVS